MKHILIIILFLGLLSCTQNGHESHKEKLNNDFSTFDNINHLQPLFDKKRFDTLHGWKFGWALLEPINIAKSRDEDKELAKRFSPGQKALYFIWYLDGQVTNGGFGQFYANDYREYLPPIIDGLRLIGDSLMIDLVNKADAIYFVNKKDFPDHPEGFNPPLIVEKTYFDSYDSIYYTIHNNTMKLIEKYARQYPEEFIKFK
jgi:Domain of unknown function (DUF4375)